MTTAPILGKKLRVQLKIMFGRLEGALYELALIARCEIDGVTLNQEENPSVWEVSVSCEKYVADETTLRNAVEFIQEKGYLSPASPPTWA